MSFLPRLRQACGGKRQGSSVPDDALCGQSQDPRLAVNWLYLSGVLATDPIEDKGRDGEPLTLLTVAFPAPDASETREGMEVASCEVEVPAVVSRMHGGRLRVGDSILFTGQLSGGGGVIATQLYSGPPDQTA